MKNYLPSRPFIIRLILIIGLALVVFGIYKALAFFKARHTSQNSASVTIAPDVIQKDSNQNGIPDWEESLWGLDPTKDGVPNKEFIMSKRQAIAAESGTTADTSKPLSENETLSREFFAVIMSLQQSGNLDESTLKAVSDTIGKKIVADPIPDIYNKTMVTTSTDEDNLAAIKYYTAVISLNTKYKDRNIGDELTFIATAVKDSDPGALGQVHAIAESYRSFGKDLLKIPVPQNLISVDVRLANDYDKVGQSLEGLTKLITDPLTGMKALINYKKYSDALGSDFDTLTDNFK